MSHTGYVCKIVEDAPSEPGAYLYTTRVSSRDGGRSVSDSE